MLKAIMRGAVCSHLQISMMFQLFAKAIKKKI